MTHAESKSIMEVQRIIGDIKEQNRLFREDTQKQIELLSNKVEQKHLPLNLENEVVMTIQKSLAEGLSKALTGYNSPLELYANNVVSKYQSSIENIFNEVVQHGIASDEFKQKVREVLLHKIAKTVTSGIDGSIDKTVNLMKQDAIFRSKLTLAVNGLVSEFLNQKQPAQP